MMSDFAWGKSFPSAGLHKIKILALSIFWGHFLRTKKLHGHKMAKNAPRNVCKTDINGIFVNCFVRLSIFNCKNGKISV